MFWTSVHKMFYKEYRFAFYGVLIFGMCAVHSSEASDYDRMSQLLPLVMQFMKDGQSQPQDLGKLLEDPSAPTETQEEEFIRPKNGYRPQVTIQPADVSLQDPPDMQEKLIKEAVKSAIGLHFTEYAELVDRNTATCRRNRRGSCDLKSHSLVVRLLIDKLIVYAGQWCVTLNPEYLPRYWDLVSETIITDIAALQESCGVVDSHHAQLYIQHKIRVKKLFGL